MCRGTFGWLLLESGEVDYTNYKHFVFVNSSVRGPYIPVYLQHVMQWTNAFTSMLSETIKLVGTSISCERAYWENDMDQRSRHNPHVQSFALATDR